MANLASLTITVAWSPSGLTFDSLRANAATGLCQTANTAGAAASGFFSASCHGANALDDLAVLGTEWFAVLGAPGGTRVQVTPREQ
jgi:hypothetical protein